LSSQAKVDARACIDENRLWYILNNQDSLRAENFQGILDAVSKGCVLGDISIIRLLNIQLCLIILLT
jgi:hypothetical protein